MSTPGVILGPPKLQLFTDDGEPAAGYLLYAFEAGTSTPQDTFPTSDVDGTPNANPVELDANGRAAVFLTPGLGYRFVLTDPDDVQAWEQDNVLDVGALLFDVLTSTGGGKAVTSGYTILDDDYLVTVASTGGADPCLINLPPAEDRGTPIIIKNLGTVALSIVRDGSDTIEGLAANYAVDAAVSPLFPTVTLLSDGESAWYITSSHGL